MRVHAILALLSANELGPMLSAVGRRYNATRYSDGLLFIKLIIHNRIISLPCSKLFFINYGRIDWSRFVCPKLISVCSQAKNLSQHVG